MSKNLIKKSKTIEELADRNCNISSLTLAESFVYYVFDDINRISHNFFDIGARLHEAHQLNYQKELFDGQYATIADLAEGVFGIKKTIAYSLMEVARKYCDNKSFLRIADKWKNYTQTQLIEMLPLDGHEISIIKERDTIADIKEWKRILRNRGSYVFQDCNTLKECLEFAHKLDELNIPATNNFGQYLSATDVEKKIEEISVQTETLIEEMPAEVSVQTEKKSPSEWDIKFEQLQKLVYDFRSHFFFQLGSDRSRQSTFFQRMLIDFKKEITKESTDKELSIGKFKVDLIELEEYIRIFQNKYRNHLDGIKWLEIDKFRQMIQVLTWQ